MSGSSKSSVVSFGARGHHRRTTCRACGSTAVQPFLDLGPSPLANAFLRSGSIPGGEALYPMELFFCTKCSLVQLLDVVDPEILFRDYIYVTGTSDTMAAHFAGYADAVVDLLGLTARDLVIEMGSNDGSLLRHFQRHGVRTLGVEPASNIAAIARANGVATIDRFFTAALATELRAIHGPARAVIGNNVLAHVDDTQDLLRGCRALLADDGCVIVEVPYLADLLERLEYDTIYHEHLCYFSAVTLMRMCAEVGLAVARIDHVPVHGGSLRVYAVPQEQQPRHASAVDALRRSEHAAGLADLERYRRFAADVAQHRRSLVDLLQGLKRSGKTVAGYGAPAKGNTLLNYCRIDADMLAFTVDKNPMKVGLVTPGMHIPVLPVSALLERQPDYVLILAWNFAEEIMRQQQAYRDRGGRFIVPLPAPEVV
jgi:hypothetical protein